MRIAHISCVFPPYGGGIGVACFQQVKELAKLGHQVTVFTPQYKKDTKAISIPGVEIREIKTWLKFGKAAVLFPLLWQLNGFDLVQLHYPFLGTDKIVWLWKKLFKTKTKLVLYYHMDLKARGLKSWFFWLHQRLVAPHILKSADKILVSSDDYMEHSSFKDFFQQHREKFVELPLAVDLEKFKPQTKDTELLKKYNLASDEQIILFVGGLDSAHYFKGLPILFQALSLVKKEIVKLMIVGSGSLMPFYQRLTRDLEIEDRVIFAGYVPDKKMPAYYNLADIFVLPSIDQSEAFGLVLLEAQACAKPAIASDLPGVRTVLKDKKTGLLFRVNDPQDLAEKLAYLLNNSNVQHSFGLEAHYLMEEKYSLNNLAQKLIEIYESL